MKADLILKNYEIAKERYAALGVDTDKAIETLEKTPISLHCWQADDVVGFERGEAASGGIQSTGNYPGKARNIDELRQDIEKVNSLLAGTFRLNLHEIYGEFGGKQIDRNEVTVDQFTGWMQWAKEQNMKLDFNSTSFSHPLSGNLTLSNPDPAIREFWIEHTKRCRRIADAMGKFQNDPCIMNIWVHDGSKDITVEKGRYREILKNSLDEILAEELPNMKSCLEAKLFGIVNRHGKDALDHISGFGVNQPLVSGFVPEIAVNDCACEVLAGLAFGLESGTDFTAGVSGVILVHNVAERGKIIVTSGTIHAVIDSDKSHATLTQDFHNLTDFQIVTTHAAHVLDTQVLHIPSFHFFHHCQKSGTVKASTTNAIVREMDNVCKALPCGELLQHCLLIGYGVALTLLVIIFAKVITAQSFVQSCDFLVFFHNLRSFLRL